MNYLVLAEKLIEFGLRRNEARVYIFLTKKTVSSAPEVSNKVRVARTEAYYILKGLVEKKIVNVDLTVKPFLYRPVSFENGLYQLIENELERIKALNDKKNGLIKSWNDCYIE